VEGGASYSKGVPTVEGGATVGMGFWKAEPGTYHHPGGPNGETFIVLEGEAVLKVPGQEDVQLRPGVTITIPASMPSSMVVRTLLRKFSVGVR
jgi:uncharacterized cupin superfamily protein